MENVYSNKFGINNIANDSNPSVARQAIKISDLDKLISHPFVNTLLFDKGISSVKDILKFLEMYKFCTRNDILCLYSNIFQDNDVLRFDDIKQVGSFDLPKGFDIGVSHNNVIVYNVDDDSNVITLITDLFEDIDRNELSLTAEGYIVEYIYVTPYNFSVLQRGQKYLDNSLDVMTVFYRILLEAVTRKASDIHFNCEYCDSIKDWIYPIDFRIKNELIRQNLFILSESLNKQLITELITKHTYMPGTEVDTDEGVVAFFSDPFKDGKLMLRLCANKAFKGYTLVIRMQNYDTSHWLIDDLGFNEQVTENLFKASRRTFGLTLITGPVRSGKNVTATALIREMKRKPIKVLSYESPIEILLPATQVPYKSIEHLVKLTALAKKQDIDVCLINEIPTKEVALSVQDLIDSSIGVVSTLHIDRVWHICSKLKHYFGDDYKDLLLQTNMIVNQKMFVKLCPHCLSSMTREGITSDVGNFFKNYGLSGYMTTKGCPKCMYTGYKGVQPYAEVLFLSEDIQDKIMKADSLYDTQKVIKDYMFDNKLSLEFTLANAIRKGELSFDCLYTII